MVNLNFLSHCTGDYMNDIMSGKEVVVFVLNFLQVFMYAIFTFAGSSPGFFFWLHCALLVTLEFVVLKNVAQ